MCKTQRGAFDGKELGSNGLVILRTNSNYFGVGSVDSVGRLAVRTCELGF